MTNFYSVIGAGYGDEGKGRVVDGLSHVLKGRTAVVRYNSSAQAAHTVKVGNDRQVFHSINSGYLNQCATIFGPQFVVCPRLLAVETFDLKEQYSDRHPIIYCDPSCRVITPYDQIYNEWINNKNGHGTCGIGFGAAIQRDIDIPFTFYETQNRKTLISKFNEIKEYYLDINENDFSKFFNEKIESSDIYSLDYFSKAQDFLSSRATIYMQDIQKFISKQDNIIFEGAQGLFLDENSEDFPHVTRSKTGSDYIREIHDGEIHNFYVTRTFQTRHGNGPLKDEFENDVYDETNGYNKFQGRFRGGPLDVDRVSECIKDDVNINNIDSYDIVLTHMDNDIIPLIQRVDVSDRLSKFHKKDTILMGNDGVRCNSTDFNVK